MKFPLYRKRHNKKRSKISAPYPFDELKNLEVPEESQASPVFITGVGRSGTHFLSALFAKSPDVKAFHLDEIGNAVADSFLFYAKWYDLPVDYDGFFMSRNYLIDQINEEGKRFLESNPYLALFTSELGKYYSQGKVLIVHRNPRDVVLSHINKGWYDSYEPSLSNWDKAPFYQYGIKKANHFFGRIFPNNETDFLIWKELTQVGKIAWMWQSVNNRLKKSISDIPERNVKVINIDNFDFVKYTEVCNFLSVENVLGISQFSELKKTRPGRTIKTKIKNWGQQEEKEFQEQITKFQGFDD